MSVTTAPAPAAFTPPTIPAAPPPQTFAPQPAQAFAQPAAFAAPGKTGFTYADNGPRTGSGDVPPGLRFGNLEATESISSVLGLVTSEGGLKNLLGKSLDKMADDAADPVTLSKPKALTDMAAFDLTDEDKKRLSLKARQLAALAETAVRLDRPKLAKPVAKGLKQFELDPRVQAWIVPIPALTTEAIDALVRDLQDDGAKGDLAENTLKAEVVANLVRTLEALEELDSKSEAPKDGDQLDATA